MIVLLASTFALNQQDLKEKQTINLLSVMLALGTTLLSSCFVSVDYPCVNVYHTVTQIWKAMSLIRRKIFFPLSVCFVESGE